MAKSTATVQPMTYAQRLSLTSDQKRSAQDKYLVNSTYRTFGQDIDANEAKLDEMNAQLEESLNSRSFSPVAVATLEVKIEQTINVIARLKRLRSELFPNGIVE